MNQRTYLYQIQNFDLEVDKNERRIKELKKIISYNDDVKEIESKCLVVESDRKKQQSTLKKISDEAATVQNKIKKSEQSLYDGSIRNPKELQSVNIELASLKNRVSVLDENQLEIMFEIENLDATILGFQNELENLLQEKRNQNEIFVNEIKDLEKSNNKLAVEKEPILSQVDPEFLLIYKKLRKTKNNVAISMVIDNSCSVCGNGLTPMDVQKTKSGEDEIYCPVCKRFLYFG